jgi:hypothetical protein
VGAYVLGVQPGIIGQRECKRRRLTARMSGVVDEVAHDGQVRPVGGKRLGDSLFKGRGTVGVEQGDKATGQGGEVLAARSVNAEQLLGRGRGVVEPVLGSMLSGSTFVLNQGSEVLGVFYLLSPVEDARMGSDDNRGGP